MIRPGILAIYNDVVSTPRYLERTAGRSRQSRGLVISRQLQAHSVLARRQQVKCRYSSVLATAASSGSSHAESRHGARDQRGKASAALTAADRMRRSRQAHGRGDQKRQRCCLHRLARTFQASKTTALRQVGTYKPGQLADLTFMQLISRSVLACTASSQAPHTP